MRSPQLYFLILLMAISASFSEAATIRTYFGRGLVTISDSGVQTFAPVEVKGITTHNANPPSPGLVGWCASENNDPIFQMGCIYSGPTSFRATVLGNMTEVELCHGLWVGNGDTGSCYAGGTAVGEITFDVTFSSPDQTGFIPVSLNFQAFGVGQIIPGAFEPRDGAHIKLYVTAGPDNGVDGIWIPEVSVGTSPPASNGIFAGSVGDTLDGLFSGEEFMAPLNTPVTITLRAELECHASWYSMNNYAGRVMGFFKDGAEGGRGISLPRDGSPVFNLPPGCTADAPDIDLTSNDFIPDPQYGAIEGKAAADCPVPGTALAGVTVNAFETDSGSLASTTLTDLNGDYLLEGLDPGNYTVSVVVPPEYSIPSPDLLATVLEGQTVEVDFAFVCAQGSVAGNVTADCPMPGTLLEGVLVEANESGSGAPAGSAQTDVNGSYLIENLAAGDYTITVVPPAGYESQANNLAVSIVAGTTANAGFPLACLPVEITGNVSALDALGQPCSGGLLGITVDLDHPNGEMLTTTTDENGSYAFPDLPPTNDDAVVAIVLPLGFLANDPAAGQTLVALDMDREVNFTMTCKDPIGEMRSMGYWKHQANVYLKNKGNAQESQADMATNYPLQIFNHFYENGYNAIEVEGVTYVDNGGSQVPINLATIHTTLSVKGNAGMEAKAKQQYLALLLNLASGKLLPSSVVSIDGATASQALQQVAALINDSISANDELAKDICDAINNAQMVAAGIVDLSISTIAYRPGQGGLPLVEGVFLGQNHPNPFNPMTKIQFVLNTPQFVELSIYDSAGRLVRTLVNEQLAKGTYIEEWNGRDLNGRVASTGVYFYRLKTAEEALTRKMILMK